MSLRGFRSLLAVLGAGFEPLGVVMGATTFQIVRPTGCWMGTFQLGAEPLIFPAYEQALRDSWRGAIERLQAEAVRVGAHGVVGVSVAQSAGTPTEPVTMLRLTGSAVRVPTAPELERPFLSMLSMEETLKMLLRGWAPKGVVYGLSAVHVHGWAASPFRQGAVYTNAEMAAPTAGMQLARERAEHEVRDTLRSVRAQGSVGATVQITRFPQSCGNGQGVLIEGRMLGTGVVRYRAPVTSVGALRDLAASGRT